jgi:hypothetical protein
MPQRALSTIWVLAGLAAALALVLVGANLVAASERGPRWKRRLLGAGLGVLAGLGLVSTAAPQAAAAQEKAAAPAPAEGKAADPARQPSLADDPAWKQLLATWKDAELPRGPDGKKPFDQIARLQLLIRLDNLEADLKALAKTKLLSDLEVALLEESRRILTQKIQVMWPDIPMATCYSVIAESAPANPDALKQVADRLPILEKLAADHTLHPEVLRLARSNALQQARFEQMLLEHKFILQSLAPAAREQAAALRKAARLNIVTLLLRDDSPATLTKAFPWSIIASTLKKVEDQRLNPGPGDENMQWGVLLWLEWSRSDLAALQRVGLLHAAEAEFLMAQLSDLDLSAFPKGDIDLLAPVQDNAKAAPPAPGQRSLARLKARLPVLDKLVAADKLHPEAVAAIVERVEADLKILTGPGAADLKADDEKQAAGKAGPAARAAIEKLRLKVKPVETPVKEK